MEEEALLVKIRLEDAALVISPPHSDPPRAGHTVLSQGEEL
jgi:hypothetical protein